MRDGKLIINKRYWLEKLTGARLQVFIDGKVQCAECGLVGTHFYVEKHINDKVGPYHINLYATVGDEEVMMTWDHILPRSLGGSDQPENSQCMCQRCNERKGNKLSIPEMIDIITDDDYLVMMKPLPQVSGTIFDTINKVSL